MATPATSHCPSWSASSSYAFVKSSFSTCLLLLVDDDDDDDAELLLISFELVTTADEDVVCDDEDEDGVDGGLVVDVDAELISNSVAI